MAGKSAIADAPAAASVPPVPLGPFVAVAILFLAGTGLADTVSMIFRHQGRQLLTPDALRERVTAANQVFVQGGPQPGQLEAGAVAAGFGAPFSVISGGVACVLTIIFICLKVPGVRRYRIEQ